MIKKITIEKVVHTRSWGYWKKYIIELRPNYYNPLTYLKFIHSVFESIMVLGYVLPFKSYYVKKEYRDTTFSIQGRK